MSEFHTVYLDLPESKEIFFASDFHLGSMRGEEGRRQERAIVDWLKFIQSRAGALFLVGDVFDYWFEYKQVVPKGGVRLLGQLAEMTDQGIPLYYFTGNHDMWVRDYFASELNATVSRKPISFTFNSIQGTKRVLVGHGDGLGPGDFSYKYLKLLFENSFARFLFRQLHPDLATRIAFAWSRHSRATNNKKMEDSFKGEAGEWLFQYCQEVERSDPHDYYIFGHRHLPLNLLVGESSRYINLGEWFSINSDYPYAVFDGEEVELKGYRGMR